ncbi:MAG: glycosyltransferase family 39 protein, partial [Chloroflexota bacterium]
TVLYSAMPIDELWELSRVTDPHPPLYYLLLHPWQWLLGESAWAMRFAGVVAGVLVVAALFALARRTRQSLTVCLLAAALLAINPLQIWLAQDIRSYPFFTLLGLLSSWALWVALQRAAQPDHKHPLATVKHPYRIKTHDPRYTPWLLYIYLTIASLYVHYYTVFLIAFQGLFVLINSRKFWSLKWIWLASQAAIGLSILPGLQLAYNFIGPAAGGIDTMPTSAILRQASTALLTGFTISNAWGLWLSLLLAPVWLFGLISLWRRDRTSGSLWTLFFALPVLSVIALSIGRPFFKERFLIQAQPAFELLLAAGFSSLLALRRSPLLPPRFTLYALRFIIITLLVTLLVANTMALVNYHTDPVYAKAPPWQLYRDYVSHEARPGDVMLTNFPEAAVSYYSPNELPFYVAPVERDRSLEFRLEQTAEIARSYRRIWFLPLLRQGFDEQGDVLNWLDRHADRVNQVFFPAYNVNLYLSPSTIDQTMIRQPVAFANGVHLRGYQILDEAGDSRLERVGDDLILRLKPEDEFTLSLYWQAGGPTGAPYTVFTHLIAADGFNRTSQDNQPVWGSYPTPAWQAGERITDKYTLTLPPGTPPGDHRLRLGWYQSGTLEPVPVLDETGRPVAEHVILTVIIRVE